MLSSRVPGARVLDLFAGSGALGLEALSRGAALAVFVERSRPALKVLRANIQVLEAGDRARVRPRDVFAFLEGVAPLAFDLALADPPYGQGHATRLVEHYLREPFARELWVEHGARDSLPDLPALRQRRYGDTILTHLEAPP